MTDDLDIWKKSSKQDRSYYEEWIPKTEMVFEDYGTYKRNRPYIGKPVNTGWGSTIKMTQDILDSCTRFLESEDLESHKDNVELLIANLMPDEAGMDAFEAGKGFSISPSDFDSWEDVKTNFKDEENGLECRFPMLK